jgi:hypothetical protein
MIYKQELKMTTYLHEFKTALLSFSLLACTMVVSFTANATSQELPTPLKFATQQVAALANPGAAVIHRRNAKERRHNAATQPSTTPTTNTQPK